MTTKNNDKELNMENRLTKLEETDKHILQMVSELKEHSVTKVEHAMVLSSVNDLQTDFDDYQRDNKKKLEEVTEILNGISYKIAMYVGGTIVTGAVFGFVVWLLKEFVAKWVGGI